MNCVRLIAWPGWIPFTAVGRRIWIACGLGAFVWLSQAGLYAAESGPEIRRGTSKAEVIRTLGLPTGVSKSGARETLSYPQGHVVLENGRVDHTDFSPSQKVLPPPVPDAEKKAEHRNPPPTIVPVPDAPPKSEPAAPIEVSSGLTSARWLIVSALCGGAAVSAVLIWLIWRKGNKGAPAASRYPSMAERISAAASGVPTRADIVAWPRERLRIVTARLAESQGYTASLQPVGGDRDIVLTHPSEAKPRVFVCCSPGSAGTVPAKRLREFVGTLAVESVLEGWFVSPVGFAFDARIYAEEPTLLLIDGERLLDQLRDLPPLMLERVLAQGG